MNDEREQLEAKIYKLTEEINKLKDEKAKGDSEINHSKKDPETKDAPTLYSDLTKTITQIGAAIAGIALIVGILGFFSKLTYNERLGLDVPFSGPFDYIAEGGEFLLLTGATIMNFGFGYFLIIPFIIAASVFYSLIKLKRKSKTNSTAVKHSKLIELLAVIAINIYLLALLYIITKYLKDSGSYLQYAIEPNKVNGWIISEDYGHLRAFYASICTPVFLMIITISYWYWENNRSSIKFFDSNSVLKSISILFLVFSIIGLSLTYGVVLHAYRFSLIDEYGVKEKKYNFLSQRSRPIDTSATGYIVEDSLFLINKDEKQTVFYLKTTRQLIYVPTEILTYYKTGETENVFKGRTTRGRTTK